MTMMMIFYVHILYHIEIDRKNVDTVICNHLYIHTYIYKLFGPTRLLRSNDTETRIEKKMSYHSILKHTNILSLHQRIIIIINFVVVVFSYSFSFLSML